MQVELGLRGRVHGAALAHHPPPTPLLGQIPDGSVVLSHVDRARVICSLADLVEGQTVRLLGKLFANQDMLAPSGANHHFTNQTETALQMNEQNIIKNQGNEGMFGWGKCLRSLV